MYYPTLDKVKELAKEGNYIPIYTEVLADMETPVSAFAKIAYDNKGQRRPYAFLLESVEGGDNIGRFSFLGCDPIYLIQQQDGRTEVMRNDEIIETIEALDALDDVRQLASLLAT